jgi:hypothetical protein
MVLEAHVVGLGRPRAQLAAISVMAFMGLVSATMLLPGQGLAGAGLAFALGAASGLIVIMLTLIPVVHGRRAFTNSSTVAQ